jgi:hypothetical protein
MLLFLKKINRREKEKRSFAKSLCASLYVSFSAVMLLSFAELNKER